MKKNKEQAMRIDELPISDEVIKILIRKGKIFDVEELLKKSNKELLGIHGIGKSQLKYIKKALYWFIKSSEIKLQKDRLLSEMQAMFKEFSIPLKHEINELRTILLEQYRLIQSIQIEKQPEGIMKIINEKIPGFSSTMYDIYKKLEEKE
jgi:DNA repair protein RadC